MIKKGMDNKSVRQKINEEKINERRRSGGYKRKKEQVIVKEDKSEGCPGNH